MLDKILALLDNSGDGVVDKAELVAFLEKNMHVEHNRALAVKMFKVLDEDHDGVISKHEPKVGKFTIDKVQILDKDGDERFIKRRN